MKNSSKQEFKAFNELSRLLPKNKVTPSSKIATSIDPFHELTDDQLFEFSTRDVVPLERSANQLKVKPILRPRRSSICKDEDLRLLQEFVYGMVEVDLRNSGEYIEGTPNPEGSRWLNSLRKGAFSIQSHLDLHGLNLTEAKESFETFIHQSLIQGHGCVRVVHGRGNHSQNNQPKLKKHLSKWLKTRRMSRHVIAYTTARLVDGGGGALYLLLRRN